MQYLLELNEFSLDVDKIIKKILSSGYISKSMSSDLDSISGVINFVDKLEKEIDYINNCFKRNDRDYYDDVLLEFFEMTNYNYTVNIGIAIDEGTGLYSDVEYLIFDDRYEKSHDKRNFLLVELLDFINKMNMSSKSKYKKDLEDLKKSDRWVRYPRGRYISHQNNFKNIESIEPVIRVNIKHKDMLNYSNNYWDNPSYTLNMKGWNYNEIFNNNGLKYKIIKRLKDSRIFGDCSIVSKSSIFTSYNFWEDGNQIRNENPILLQDTFYIKKL